MIAVFFKNHKPDPETQEILAQSQAALEARMHHMLRQEAKIAWATPRPHLPFPGAVKKPISIRNAIAVAI
jgi:hypothetical protein